MWNIEFPLNILTIQQVIQGKILYLEYIAWGGYL